MLNKYAQELSREKIKVKYREQKRILKNIVVLSLGFMLHFTSYQGMSNLQSSINAAHGLGTKALSVIYVTICICCIFLPTFVIRRLTAKWTIVVSMLCYMPFIALQIYPGYLTLLPASILLGLVAGPMWAALSTYITQLGQIYAIIADEPIGGIIVQFFGFFFLAWQIAEVWGNLISGLVLSSENSLAIDSLERCGAQFCNEDAEHIFRPPDHEISLLTTIYLFCVIIACLIITIFLDSLRRYGEKRRGSSSANTGFDLLLSTIRQIQKSKQLLLMPITIWIGLEQSFIGAAFTRSYVACALGVESIGYVMICFGVVNAICSILFGSIMKYIGRIPIMILGSILHIAIVIFMLSWRPELSHHFVFYLMSGLWGVSDAVWQTQINGFYGILFRRNKEAAFSIYRLWESIGFVIGYTVDTYFCTKINIYTLLTFLFIGLIGYIIVEVEYVIKHERLNDMGSLMHSNISLFRRHSFLSHIVHKPEVIPSHHINSGDPDDDEIDELEDDVVVEADNETDTK